MRSSNKRIKFAWHREKYTKIIIQCLLGDQSSDMQNGCDL